MPFAAENCITCLLSGTMHQANLLLAVDALHNSDFNSRHPVATSRDVEQTTNSCQEHMFVSYRLLTANHCRFVLGDRDNPPLAASAAGLVLLGSTPPYSSRSLVWRTFRRRPFFSIRLTWCTSHHIPASTLLSTIAMTCMQLASAVIRYCHTPASRARIICLPAKHEPELSTNNILMAKLPTNLK